MKHTLGKLLAVSFTLLFSSLAHAADQGATGKCQAGDARACFEYGESLEFGDPGIAKNPQQAIRYYDKSCQMGNSDGCSGVAGMLYFGAPGVEKNHAKAFNYGLNACKRGSTAGGCYYAAKVAFEGENVPHNPENGAALLQHGCKIKDSETCGYGAYLYSEGKFGLKADAALALNYASRGCSVWQRKSKFSCFMAGWLSSGNLGLKKETEIASNSYERGCVLGSMESCMNGGVLLQKEKGINAAGEKIISLYKKGCELGNAQGCYSVAQAMAQQGKHLDAYPWAKKSCDLKLKEGCSYTSALDKYKADLIKHQQAMAQYEQRIAAVTAALKKDDFNKAIYHAVNELRDRDQAARVIVAAENAGKIGSIDNYYFYNLSNWFVVSHSMANGIVQRELKAIKQAEKASQNHVRIAPVSGMPKLSSTMADQFQKFYDNSYKQNLSRYLAGGRPSDTRVYNLRK